VQGFAIQHPHISGNTRITELLSCIGQGDRPAHAQEIAWVMALCWHFGWGDRKSEFRLLASDMECGNSYETLSYHPFTTFCPVLRTLTQTTLQTRFLALIIPIIPIVFAILSYAASQVREAWRYAIAGALFFGWTIASVFPLSV
jgi:hypothetical protein